MKTGTMLGWRFPAALEFDVRDLQEFVFPDHLGLDFTREFFEPGGAGWPHETLGATGLEHIANDRCPEGAEHDLALLAPGHGDWLSGYRLGAYGCLLRFGGMARNGSGRPQAASVSAALAHLHSAPRFIRWRRYDRRRTRRQTTIHV